MALVLSLHEGEDFFVQDTRFILIDVYPLMMVIERCIEGRKGLQFEVNDRKAVEIYPNVMASCGLGNDINFRIGKIALQAPRSIIINRGSKHRGGR